MVKIDLSSGRVFAAARALAGMTQGELAAAANVSISTIKRVEGIWSDDVPGVLPNNLSAIRAALEAAGVQFIAENGGGAGVRLRKE